MWELRIVDCEFRIEERFNNPQSEIRNSKFHLFGVDTWI